MKLITQEEPMGCGVACVASVLKVSYKKALNLFKNKEHSFGRGYYCKELIDSLKKGKLSYTYSKYNDSHKDILMKDGTIVFIKRSKKYPLGHYLVRYKGKWMNSWINMPCIAPAKSGFETKLPGKPQWIIYNIGK